MRNIGKTAAEFAESSPIDNLHIVQLAHHVLNVCNQCHTHTTADSTPKIHNSWSDVGLEISDFSNSHIIKDINGMQKNYVPHSLQKWHAYIIANLNPEWQNKTDAFLRQSQRSTDIVSDNQFHFDCWIPGNISSDMESLEGTACSTNTSVWAHKPVPRLLQVLHYDAEMYYSALAFRVAFSKSIAVPLLSCSKVVCNEAW